MKLVALALAVLIGGSPSAMAANFQPPGDNMPLSRDRSAYFQDKEYVRINPYTRHVSSISSQNLIVPMQYPIAIAKSLQAVAFSDLVSGAYILGLMDGQSTRYPLVALSGNLRQPRYERCQESGEICHALFTYPNGYLTPGSTQPISLSIVAYDDLGIPLLERQVRVPGVRQPDHFSLLDNLIVRYDRQESRLQGRLLRRSSFADIVIRIEIVEHGVAHRQVYTLDDGEAFDMPLPDTVEKLTVEAQAWFSERHQYHATIALWDRDNPFFAPPAKRWTLLLTKGLLHNDMGANPR